MPRQKGVHPITGTVDDLTYYQTRDGNLVRRKGTLNRSRIANDKAFERTRENGAEFSRAGKAGRVLRNAFRVLLLNTSDGRMIGRLVKELMKVIHADLTSPRGLRNVIDGEAELLKGFEFNVSSNLGTTLYAPYAATINRVTGELKVTIASFIPRIMIAAPSGATHFKISSSGAEIDFETEVSVTDVKATAYLPLDDVATAAISLVNTVTPNSTKPLFLVLGIEFFQYVNGVSYPLNSGAFNSLALVEVSGV